MGRPRLTHRRTSPNEDRQRRRASLRRRCAGLATSSPAPCRTGSWCSRSRAARSPRPWDARSLRICPSPRSRSKATSPPRVDDALTVPPGSEWLVDYDRAVEVGMAVTVNLAGGQAAVERVIAVGTRASLAPGAAADELEDLLVGHRFRTGLALLPQGTTTNNADAERSPYRARTSPEPPPLTPPSAQPGSDTSAAAGILGIDAAVLTGLVGDGTGEQTIARLVNTALWAPGWGEYLSRLDDEGVPGVVDAQRESARGLFRDHVRGRGPGARDPGRRPAIRPAAGLRPSGLGARRPGRQPPASSRSFAPCSDAGASPRSERCRRSARVRRASTRRSSTCSARARSCRGSGSGRSCRTTSPAR